MGALETLGRLPGACTWLHVMSNNPSLVCAAIHDLCSLTHVSLGTGLQLPNLQQQVKAGGCSMLLWPLVEIMMMA
jgi:hypothetical protein